MDYLTLKLVHVLSSTVVFGTGIGSAYYFFFAARNRDPAIVAFVAGAVVIADWIFTATTMVIQPLTGWLMLGTVAFPWDAMWLSSSLVLYLVALACWIPVVVLQTRMRDLARSAHRAGTPLGADFERLFRWWTGLGFPALFAFLGIFYLMVFKPI